MFNALRHTKYTTITTYPVNTVLKILHTYCSTDSMDISSSRPQRLAGSINNNTPTVTTMRKILSRTTSLWTTSHRKKTAFLTQAPFSSRTSSRYLHGPSRTAEKLRLHLPLHGTLHGTFTDLHGFLLFEKPRVRWWVR